jgi:hypothetical protein
VIKKLYRIKHNINGYKKKEMWRKGSFNVREMSLLYVPNM